jgi:hypothetical protein
MKTFAESPPLPIKGETLEQCVNRVAAELGYCTHPDPRITLLMLVDDFRVEKMDILDSHFHNEAENAVREAKAAARKSRHARLHTVHARHEQRCRFQYPEAWRNK